MEVIIEPDHTPYLYNDDYTMVYLTSEQIRSIKQLIDYEQLYETNTDVNEHWNSIRRQLDEDRQTYNTKSPLDMHPSDTNDS